MVCFSSRKPLRRLFSRGSDTQFGSGITRKDLSDADVTGAHLDQFVAGLAHDVALARSVHGGLGDKAGA
jgi:hypothetical protein